MPEIALKGKEWSDAMLKKTEIMEKARVVPALHDEIFRTEESRYFHRLHGVLLVAQGLSCRQAARLLGDAPRTIAYWVRSFEDEGLAGLTESARPGRPPRLNPAQLEEVRHALGDSPAEFGLKVSLWDGNTLSRFIAKKWRISLGVRQSQRLLRQLGYGTKKRSIKIAHGRSA